MLLNDGAKVDAADSAGNTALHVAAQQGELEIVEAAARKGRGSERKERQKHIHWKPERQAASSVRPASRRRSCWPRAPIMKM